DAPDIDATVRPDLDLHMVTAARLSDVLTLAEEDAEHDHRHRGRALHVQRVRLIGANSLFGDGADVVDRWSYEAVLRGERRAPSEEERNDESALHDGEGHAGEGEGVVARRQCSARHATPK